MNTKKIGHCGAERLEIRLCDGGVNRQKQSVRHYEE
jgi:hypothetical protein